MPNLIIVKDNCGSKYRSFNPNWYKKYEWLTDSESNNKLYCWNCILFNEKSNMLPEFQVIMI